MSKKSKIIHQALNNLKAQTKYGESKHEAKQKARQEAKEKGERFHEVHGIYSTDTYKSYSKVCRQFIKNTVEKHPEVKSFDDCKKYVPEFLQDKIDNNRSAWTLANYASALASAYNCGKNDFGVKLPIRERANVKRCRGINSSDYRYPQEKWDTIKMVLKATGCRRFEALRLRKEDFREREDGNLEVYKRGKNGIERWCLVNPKYTEQLREWYKSSTTYRIDGEDRIIHKSEIPRGSVHDLRSDYACDLYRYFDNRGDVATGKIYYCRKEMAGTSYDKGILSAISENLSHERTNVVISYLWKGI